MRSEDADNPASALFKLSYEGYKRLVDEFGYAAMDAEATPGTEDMATLMLKMDIYSDRLSEFAHKSAPVARQAENAIEDSLKPLFGEKPRPLQRALAEDVVLAEKAKAILELARTGKINALLQETQEINTEISNRYERCHSKLHLK